MAYIINNSDGFRFNSGTGPGIIYLGGVTISSSNDAIAISKLDLGTENNPFILSASGSSIYVNNSVFSSFDSKTILVASDGADFTSVKTAIESITDATASNVYTVRVRSGIYYEQPFTIPSYVALVGESSISTIIQATFSDQTLVTLSDQSGIFDVQIQGCTDTGAAAVVYSSATTPQTNAIAYVENVRFGQNYTHAKVIGTGSNGNCIMQCSNIKYGGYSFTLGFHATNAGTGIGRMQLRNVTSTNGGITTTTGLVFAKADASGCGFIVNGCLLTKSAGAAAGTGFQVENGGFLRLTGVNFQRWATAIYAPNDSGSPSIDAIALNFENNTIDIQIDNTKATGKIQGADSYTKTIISATSSLYVVNKDPKRIQVAKKGGDFSSVASAVNSLSNTSESNRYVIEVGPGVFYEGLIDLSTKPYVSIVGSNIQTTQIVASYSNHNLIKMGLANEVSFLSLNDVGSGYAAIIADDSGDFSQVHKLSFYNCDIGIKVLSASQDTLFYGEYVDFNGSYSRAVVLDSQSSGYRAFANIENFYCFPSATGSRAVEVLNPLAEVNIAAASIQGAGNDIGIYGENGAILNVTSMDILAYETGLYIENAGTFSSFDFNAVTIDDTTTVPINVQHPYTKGLFQGSLNDHTTIVNNSESVYWQFLDRLDGEINITRKGSVTFVDGTTTDFTALLFESAPMGILSGGEISISSGLTVSISSGYGYLENTTGDVYQRIDWSTSLYQLPDNSSSYIYINENSNIVDNTSLPSITNNIVLGRVVTLNGGILFIENTRVDSKHSSNKLNLFNRRAFGSIYESGSIVTEGSFSQTLNVTSGSYWFGNANFAPTGGSGITFSQFYRDGSGGWIISSTTGVTGRYDDGSGSLVAMTTGYYTKHTLYVVGEGFDEKYLLVVGQSEYANLVDAEASALSTPPSYIDGAVVSIAAIYMQQGGTGILQIEDIKPVLGFKSSGVNASSDHGNLLGLADDDHPQYLLADGTRSMTNNLVMGSNSITGVLQVNGVTIESHASRHLPNGSDPLTTGVPYSIGTVSSEGILNAFARQDHIHAHDDQPGGSLHSVATTDSNGFMSSTDKTTFDAIPTTYVNKSGDTMTGGLTMSGGLVMNSYSIFSVLKVNGVVVESHASRHLPGGLDALTTGTPSSIGTASSEGSVNAFARQDHIHAHDNQPGGSLHSVATTDLNGFMSSTDKTTFDAIPTTYVKISDGFYSIVSVTTTTYNAAQTTGNPVLLVNTVTAGGSVTINLPTAVSNKAIFTIKKIDSGASSVVIDGNSTQTIDGSLTATITVPYTSITLVSDNSNWYII